VTGPIGDGFQDLFQRLLLGNQFVDVLLRFEQEILNIAHDAMLCLLKDGVLRRKPFTRNLQSNSELIAGDNSRSEYGLFLSSMSRKPLNQGIGA